MKPNHTALASAIISAMLIMGSQSANASSAKLLDAEQKFWAAAKRTENTGIISAYLLHFSNGRFVDGAEWLYQKRTGQAWTASVADQTAWRDPANDSLSDLSDNTVRGRWQHQASCDVNFFVQDVNAQSEQTFRLAASGKLEGESTFSSGDSFKGNGEVLELRRKGSVVTYVMAAQNSLTGSEVHIGILNLRQENGQYSTRGWEMNTGGAYCDLSGQKIQ